MRNIEKPGHAKIAVYLELLKTVWLLSICYLVKDLSTRRFEEVLTGSEILEKLCQPPLLHWDLLASCNDVIKNLNWRLSLK